jgi:uncharacterized Zn finger protein (UPF0148 family)
MKVYYKLDVNDIKQLIAEKYGVSTKGIGTCMTTEGPGFMVDMSKTETPEPVPFRDYVSPFLGKKEEPAEEKPEPAKIEEQQISPEFMQIVEENKKWLEKNKNAAFGIPSENVSDEVFQELQYKRITDQELLSCLEAGLKVPEICEKYGLTKPKYASRLYWRINKDRYSEASDEKKDPRSEETKQILRELRKVQKKEKDEHGVIWYICPVCKKRFNTEKYPDYSYKDTKHVFCGYDCMRKAEKALTPEG